MRRVLFLAVAGALLGASGGERDLSAWTNAVARIEVRSTKDGTMQPMWFLAPARKQSPLLVILHTWSADLNRLNHYWDPYDWCRRRGWALACPNFRGPNERPEACASALALQDVVDAVNWVKDRWSVDADRVYVMGGSGGGHMALMMAGYAPEIWAGVVAWCSISDLALWHEQVKLIRGCGEYASMLDKACGGTPAECPEEYRLRSPKTWLGRARDKGVHVYIGTGIHDGHRPKGYAVPAGHSVLSYNLLAEPSDRISPADLDRIDATESAPPSLAFKGPADPFYPEKWRIHLRKTSENVQLTLFEGGHDCNFPAGFEWMSRQVRGKAADWSQPVADEDVKFDELTH